jgi:hypothetical protein
LTLDSFF